MISLLRPQRVKTSLLSNYNNIIKKTLERESNSDEETTSLTSASSASDTQSTPRCDEKRVRRQRILPKGARKNATNCNNRRGKRTSNATSLKPHDAPMQKRDMYFALDCEMVGIGHEGLDSALARLSIINWDNQLVLDTYVRVQEEVTDYRTFVSGIKREDIESASAMSLEEVQYVASQILRGKILIGHGLHNDLKVIGITHPWCDIRDTTTYEPYMRETLIRKGESPVLRPRKLRDLAWEKLGEQIQVMGTAHSPIEDAIATMKLYKEVRAKWEMSLVKQVYSPPNPKDCQSKIERPPIMSRFRKVAVEPTSRPYYPHLPHNSMRHIEFNVATTPSQHYKSFIPNPQSIGGTYHHTTARHPTVEERLAAARVAQQQARFRASAALSYQTMMQSRLVQSHYNHN